MVVCCPNAGYYEFLFFESDWVNFYLRKGLNVFIWNYRGYGRSRGLPSPDALRRDGCAMIDYLRDELGIQKIGVHGTSMGGMVACYLAREKDLDFLVADRTFASLSRVA